MDNSKIAARVIIVTFKTGAWRPERLHKRETAHVNASHNVVDRAKVRVRVCDHPALESITKIHAEAYQWHISRTRPTVDDGIRLLPCATEFDYMDGMRKFHDQHDVEVRKFLGDYEQEASEAPIKLNGLYDASMWPALPAVEKKFKFSVDTRPTPTQGRWADWLSVSAKAAQDELQDSLEAAIRHVAERCASDGRLYESVFSNLKELLDLVPDLDLLDDPRIKQISQEAQKLTEWQAREVVNAPNKRKQIAKDADRLAKMFGNI